MTLLVFSHSFLLFFYCRSASPKDWVESARCRLASRVQELFNSAAAPAAETRHGGNLFQRRRPQPLHRAEFFFSSACLRRSPMPGNSSSTLSEMRLMRSCAL